jgi:glycerol-3-phosphate O-acyltransferase/dihydroxyacetone phosphate acyltransferase
MLGVFGLRDHQVEDTTSRRQQSTISAPLLIKKALLLIVVGFVFVISVLINLPIIIVARSYSRKKAKGIQLQVRCLFQILNHHSEALAASSVKITGRDVVATWKLMVALILIPTTYISYSTSCALIAFIYYQHSFTEAVKVFGMVMGTVISISYVGIRTGETLKNNLK